MDFNFSLYCKKFGMKFYIILMENTLILLRCKLQNKITYYTLFVKVAKVKFKKNP